MHEGLLDIVRYAKEKNITTYIYTSGITLNNTGKVESIPLNILQELYNLSVDKIIFDLPAINEFVYNQFMGTIGHQKLAFESIYKTLNAGIYTEIHFVPTKINVGEIDNILEFAEKSGVDKVSFLGLVPHGRAKQNMEKLVLNANENERLKLKLKQITSDKVRVGIPLQCKNDEYSCYAGKNKLCIRYDGKVFGCEAFKYIPLVDEKDNNIEPDSIYNKNLEDIYFQSDYLKFERKFIEHQMRENNCGEKCPVQRALRKVLEL